MKHCLFFNLILFFFLAPFDVISQSVDYTQPGDFTKGIEGPATDYLGNVYAVNYQEEGTIGIVTPDGKASLFLKLPNGSIGNGIRFGGKNKMYVADYINHNILKITTETKKIEVFAHQSLANQPNDIAISDIGVLYASDPNWVTNTGNVWKVTKEKGFELLEGNMGTTNGIEVSPDNKKLYVNESVQRKIWVYDITNTGFIKNKKLFFSFDNYGLDGMRCDNEGNLYICRYGKGSIVVLSEKGVFIKEYMLNGKKPTNITFGSNYETFFITMADRGCIEAISNTF
ncbi:Sugar lactone lactonase YvrE [Aquimarina amphilecti]|uniref:Sugar lactone lactonase YvrE n=1 Tax=Aquimarina amphilecti TaxID=1038014 RepID=A0A1H7WWW8_AQUAM|nr:SMP-30/gluconolactonase/LRE family protein [Aquimarina amphilecti]SEM25931.1 Sugar lactone lactonase YvrE [Aquimarina amphilecti]